MGNTLKHAEGKPGFVYTRVQSVQKDSNLAEMPVLPNQEKLLSAPHTLLKLPTLQSHHNFRAPKQVLQLTGGPAGLDVSSCLEKDFCTWRPHAFQSPFPAVAPP